MNKWNSEWPIKPGWYWFYGDPHSKESESRFIGLYTVKVRKISNGFAHICEGHFIYKEIGMGLWLEMNVPSIPERKE